MIDEGSDVTVCSLPLFHSYGILYLFYNLVNGATTVLQQRFNAENFVVCVDKYKATYCWIVPPMLTAVVEQQQRSRRDMSSLRCIVSSAAPLTKKIIDRARLEFPNTKHIFQFFGMTEVFIALMPPMDIALRYNKDEFTIGKLLPGFSAKVIIPIEGRLAEPMEEGELALKSPCCFSRYHKNYSATKNAFTEDGFFLTGDLVYYDEDGVFHIKGRLKDIIKYKGFQVSPAELEDVLRQHKAVSDAVVVPVDDEEAGQLPMAFVVLNGNNRVSKSDLLKYMSEQLVGYKQLRGGIEFIEKIPTSASGKVLRRLLLEEFQRQRRKQSKL